MPLYEYHCNHCDIDFEMRRSFSDSSTPECPVCHESTAVSRRFSPPAIVFKGSGFYVNDSRGKNAAGAPARTNGSANGNGKTPASENKTATSNSGEAKTKTEKPAAKTPAKSD